MPVQIGLTRQLISDTQRGVIDAAVVSRPPSLPAGMEFTLVSEEKLQLLAAPGAISDDPIHLLKTEWFIRFNRDAVVSEVIENWLRSRDIQVRETMELESLEAISSMAPANPGVSLVPVPCVVSPFELPVKRLSLGGDRPKRALGMIWRRDSSKKRVLEKVLTALRLAVDIGGFTPETPGFKDRAIGVATDQDDPA
ncbi:LysR substrate-binding domain-containing protein [Ruegeria marina]|uniref:LysR substrate binding domain-containing protein n=1 Tax=Ruegeria marina TaxID=639004 RepID=A0A1G6PD13_9RHOB|nr:LysR substrate-binding domain-containing protein [Ruegeria marina]SDC77888.1 LysR substrate binding domain-containing protein [Ruegeria marina]